MTNEEPPDTMNFNVNWIRRTRCGKTKFGLLLLLFILLVKPRVLRM